MHERTDSLMKKKFKISFNSPVILGFAGICLIAMLLNMVTFGQSNKLLFMTYHSSIASPLTYLRFFTHVLGHAGWQHLVGNMSYILLLGPMMEEKYGGMTILIVILITGLVTGLINYIFFPFTALLGASGVVFAFIILSSFTGFNDGEIPLTFILVSVIYIGQQIVEGIAGQDNISQMAHIFGGIVGGIAGFLLNRKKAGAGK